MKYRFIAVAITSAIIISNSAILTAPAKATVCTTAICAPNADGIIDMRRPLNGQPPITACEILNNWVVDLVVQVVGGITKVHWVATLVPTLVCHLVG